ncbi:hypothetical protein [Streptomyces sp. BE230]|uniref:hypothetical protein n=1 Tax=Streptomyces sp. BE230 TaxID=3002526 RepID=UPI002ED4015A|nr:hypothetical protein [Streptomyces sp. BE230]
MLFLIDAGADRRAGCGALVDMAAVHHSPRYRLAQSVMTEVWLTTVTDWLSAVVIRVAKVMTRASP